MWLKQAPETRKDPILHTALPRLGQTSSTRATRCLPAYQAAVRGISLSLVVVYATSLLRFNFASSPSGELIATGLRPVASIPTSLKQVCQVPWGMLPVTRIASSGLSTSWVKEEHGRADTVVSLFSLGPHLPAHSMGELSHAA